MKVLHVNCSDVGSTGKIINEISFGIHRLGGESILCTPKIKDHSECLFEKKYKVSSRFEQALNKRINYFVGLPYGIFYLSTLKIIYIIEKEKPDLIHFH